MRYIDIEKLKNQLPTGWEERAAAALAEIRSLPKAERAKAIDARSQIWAELKVALANISHKKCWYCEAKDDRYDNDVDHFRPKKSVAECSDHEGYWWIAFYWRNFRYSCTYCNRRRTDRSTGIVGGKQDHFPIRAGSTRAYSDVDNIGLEEPYLLDPTISTDPLLLWFQDDGNVVSRYSERESCWLYERAEKSIELYNLRNTDILERRLALIEELKDAIEVGDMLEQQLMNGDKDAGNLLDRITRILRRKMNEDEEYSSVTRAILMGRRNSIWVQSLFATM